MKLKSTFNKFVLLICLLVPSIAISQVQITFPVKRIVFQRNSAGAASVTVSGNYSQSADKIEARFTARNGQGSSTDWASINASGGIFQGTVTVQGGWYDLEVRALLNGAVLSSSTLERVGVGEVFMIAGQSNGQGRPDQTDIPAPQDDRINVITGFVNNESNSNEPSYPNSFPVFDKMSQLGQYAPYGITAWCWGHLGDLLTSRLNVPVLFINSAYSATGAYNWSESAQGLPTKYPFASSVTMPTGLPYSNLKIALQYYGNLTGVRSVLWHQGEWDGLAGTSTDTYYNNLKTTIEKSRADFGGKNISWMIARVSQYPTCDNCPVGLTRPSVIAGQNKTIQSVQNCFAGPESDLIQNPRNAADAWHFYGSDAHRRHGQAWFDAMVNTGFFSSSQPQTPNPLLQVAYTCLSAGQFNISLPVSGNRYVWTNAANTSVATTRAFSAQSGVTYFGRVKDASGNNTFAAPFLVPAKLGAPVITANASAICGGESTTLTASGAGTNFVWSNGQTGKTITVSTSGTYTAQVKDANGCESSVSNQVTLNVRPVPSAPVITSSGITANVCPENGVTLSSSAGTSYRWSTNETSQTIKISQAGTYTARVIDENGCQSPVSNAIAVSFAPKPATPTIATSGNTAFCEGGQLTLTSSTADSYRWSNSAQTRAITIDKSGDYSLYTVSSFGCRSDASNTVRVAVHPIPEKPTILAEGPAAVCAGNDATLTTSSNASSFVWSNGGTSKSIKVNKAGEYTLIVKNALGCSSPVSDPFGITVNPLPATPTITASGPTKDFCPENPITLTSSTADVYVWSNNTNGQSLTTSVPGSYTVRVMDSKGCASNPSSVVTVAPYPKPATPVVTALSAVDFCEGGTVTLASTQADSYYWNTDNLRTKEINITKAGKYSLHALSNHGCRSDESNAVDVWVRPLPAKPTIVADGTTSICTGNSVTLSSNLSESIYMWSNGANSSSISTSTAGSYTLQVKSSFGCSSPVSDAVNVVVNPRPAKPTIVAVGNVLFCEDKSVTLLTPVSEAGYQWNSGETAQSITVKKSGSYSLQTKNAFNCLSPSSDPIVTTARALPKAPVIAASSAVDFCAGQSVTLTSSNTSLKHNWSTATSEGSFVSVTQSGNYTAQVIDEIGCVSPVSNSIAVKVYDLPTMPEIIQAGVYKLQAGGTGEIFHWKYNDEVITPTASLIKAAASGKYSVQSERVYTLSGGKQLSCLSEKFATFNFVLDPKSIQLSIYPNPTTNGKVTVETLREQTNLTVRLFTLTGQMVLEKTYPIIVDAEVIDLQASPGQYILTLEGNGVRVSKRIVVENR